MEDLSVQSIEKNQLKLKAIFDRIKDLDPNIPKDVNELIKLHIKAQFIMAKIEEEAIINEGEAYIERKRVQAELQLQAKGTVIEKQSKAELQITELRKAEVRAKAIARSYMRQFKAIDNTIIAYRFDEKVLHEEYMKANDIEER